MFSKLTTILNPIASVITGTSGRRLALATTIVFFGSTSVSLAVNYDFLPIISTGPASSQFQSLNYNGVINVTDAFSSGGAGGFDNINTAIFPSSFPVLFPGSGQVQGHLAQTVYNHTSTVTFDLTGYTLSSSTVFGIWNITDEVTAPVGGPAVYNVQLIDANNNQVAPSTFTLFGLGNEDDVGQVAGRSRLLMNTATGDLSAGAVINPNGTHTDAAFWYNIPTTTKEIIVYGNLPPLNNIGDGVGYYFAEVEVPEPASLSMLAAGALLMLRRRR
ncbi:MAG: PEP-CTERM sorting domain-containing protein [Tepidisphaeraceae bacterium]